MVQSPWTNTIYLDQTSTCLCNFSKQMTQQYDKPMIVTKDRICINDGSGQIAALTRVTELLFAGILQWYLVDQVLWYWRDTVEVLWYLHGDRCAHINEDVSRSKHTNGQLTTKRCTLICPLKQLHQQIRDIVDD